MRKLPLTRRTHGMAFDARPNPSFACQTSLASTTLLSKVTESQLHSNKQVTRGAVVAAGCTPTGVTWRIASQELRAKLHALKAQVVPWSSFPFPAYSRLVAVYSRCEFSGIDPQSIPSITR